MNTGSVQLARLVQLKSLVARKSGMGHIHKRFRILFLGIIIKLDKLDSWRNPHQCLFLAVQLNFWRVDKLDKLDGLLIRYLPRSQRQDDCAQRKLHVLPLMGVTPTGDLVPQGWGVFRPRRYA